jgi:hypothetical protein
VVLSDPELTQAVSTILLCSEWVASVAERFQLDNDNNQILYGCRAPVSNLSNRRAGVSQFEGTYPGRFYSGPTVQRSIDLSSWRSAAIKANGNSYDFFVNNRLVAHGQEIDGVQGSVNIGTLAPGSEYRTTEACQFRDLIVRQR